MREVKTVWPWQTDRYLAAHDLLAWKRDLPFRKSRIECGVSIWGTLELTSGGLIGLIPESSRLIALDPNDGAVRWERRVQRAVRHRMVADEAHLYVLTEAILKSFRLADGKLRWRSSPPASRLGGKNKGFAQDTEAIFVTDSCGGLQKIDCQTGKLMWQVQAFPDEARSNGTPVILNGMVFVHCDQRLAAFDRETGEKAWEVEAPLALDEDVQVHRGSLLTFSEDGMTFRRPEDGSALHHVPAPLGETITHCRPSAKGVFVVLRSTSSIPTPEVPRMRHSPERVALLDAEGNERWSLPYPPFAMTRLSYDDRSGLLFESTPGEVGIVNVDQGVRRGVICGIPCRGKAPCRVKFAHSDSGHYGLTSRGTMLTLSSFPNA